jgi:AraC family transcriptional regulator, regulatory protein of adaptative response / methylated-DNA-[protein]-cysteine methyltransferase
MNDYERIAQVICYLDAHRAEQPGLAELAEQAGLSPFHFHRLFSRWAGLTPKDFLQCLTLDYARRLLRQGETVLGAALEAGVSGPGRLHDLCVTLEAASPGELKRGGQGWKLSYGFADSPFGECLIGESPRGICYLAFAGLEGREEQVKALREAWPNAELIRSNKIAAERAAAIFDNPSASPGRESLRAYVKGSSFQVRVWRALLTVPEGSLVTYRWLAQAIGQPSASRAVGGAVGSNPLAYLIPCHRVIRQTGVLGGYRWGDTRKRALIAWETSRKSVAAPELTA